MDAKDWAPVEIVVLDANLKVSRGDDSDTYRATGTFQYTWNGQNYTSDKILLSRGSDSDRKFHNNIVRQMRSAKSRPGSMVAYVNPKEPGQAVLHRDIRWNMVGFMTIFSLIFGGVGAGIIAGAQYVGRVIERENKRKLQHPDRPWLWKDQWQTAEIKNSGKATFYGALGFAVLWNLISLPLWFILPAEVIEKKNYLALIGALFPIVGIGLVFWTIKAYRQLRRFGETSFVLDIGHALQGKLTFRENLPTDTTFEVKLSCIYKYSTGTGDDRRTVEDIKWQDEQHIPLSAAFHAGTFALPIRFKLPINEHATAWDDDGREYIWRLSIMSEQDGADFKQDFDVPVFDPKDYNIRIPASARVDASADTSSVYTYQGDWQKTGVQAFEIANGHAYYFKAARHKTAGFFLTIMGLVFGGVGIAPLFSDMPVFMGLVFGGFALLMLWLASIMWLYKTQIEVFPGTLSVRGGMFRGSYKTVDANEIADIEMKSTMTSGNVKYYDVNAKLKDGGKIKMAIHLLGKRDVQSLIEKIREDLDLPAGQ